MIDHNSRVQWRFVYKEGHTSTWSVRDSSSSEMHATLARVLHNWGSDVEWAKKNHVVAVETRPYAETGACEDGPKPIVRWELTFTAVRNPRVKVDDVVRPIGSPNAGPYIVHRIHNDIAAVSRIDSEGHLLVTRFSVNDLEVAR